jgi:hypothetical protein
VVPPTITYAVSYSYSGLGYGWANGLTSTGVLVNGVVTSWSPSSVTYNYSGFPYGGQGILGEGSTYPYLGYCIGAVRGQVSITNHQARPQTTATATTSTTTTITGPFVAGLEYLDGYLFVMNQQGVIYQSEPVGSGGPTVWNALNYIVNNSDPDIGVALTKVLNYIIGFGSYHMDVYYDAGNPSGSVLNKYQASKSNVGCASGKSVAKAPNTCLWIGQTQAEGRGVYILDGTSPQKVSSRYIDIILNGDTLVDVHSYCMNYSGHTLYVLSLPGSNRTLVYDLEEKVWTQWTSTVGGVDGWFKLAYFNGNVEYGPNLYFQHDTTGQVYIMRPNIYKDDTNTINFKVTTPLIDFGNTKRKFYRRAEIIGDKVAATLSISHTDDDYATFSTPRIVDLSYGRSVLYQLGFGRRRAWRIQSTDNQPIRLNALELDVESAE